MVPAIHIAIIAILLMEVLPTCDAFDGTVIVAQRTGSVGGLGHLGVAFENQDGTWTAGAIEGFESKIIKPGDFNGAWVRNFNNRYEVEDEFSRNTLDRDADRHEAYDMIKIIPVKEADQNLASSVINDLGKRGYSIPFNDCLTGTNDVLKAYGLKNLPPLMNKFQSINLFGADYVPRVYFYLLRGKAIPLPSAGANQPGQDTEEGNDLGGINFTEVKLTYISVNTDSWGRANFSSVLEARKGEGADSGIEAINSTLISASAFMTGLALPNPKFWVNLNPWEPGRIMDEQLGQTDAGRIMLEADLQMKKDFSAYGNPCANETGKAFWNLLRQKQLALVRECMEKFPGEIRDESDVSFMAMTRFWIVPESAYAYDNGTGIYIINSTLTIHSDPIPEQSEQSAFLLDDPATSLSKGCSDLLNRSAKEYSRYARELEESMILPYVVDDVNHAERYHDLRSVYTSLALAQGYKEKMDRRVDFLRNSVDSSNLTSLKSGSPWSPEEIWERYAYSYKNKEYQCWQNRTTNTTFITGNNQLAAGTRTESLLFTSGGVDFGHIMDNLTLIEGMAPEVQADIDEAISKGSVERGRDVLIGAKIPIEVISEAIGSGPSPGPDLPPAIPQSGETHTHAHMENTTEDETGYYVCNSCPDGWKGPDENCRCWKSECPAGYDGPDENGNCWKYVAGEL